MKASRTPDDICLLCQNNKADKKGSHYTPAGIIKRVIGERDYEELYSINSFATTTSVYYGRSNLSNTNPTIKKPNHIEDYIFCSSCEKKLAVIEGECNNKLMQISDELTKGRLEVRKTAKGNKFISFANPQCNVLITFFYSIIWRQCLQQKVEFHSTFISESFQEQLREIIYKEISKTINEIEKSSEFESYPQLIIITTYLRGNPIKGFINPNPTPANPELFFIGPYNAFIFYAKSTSVGF